jgi:GNAT superfamily N-acetyltransferase
LSLLSYQLNHVVVLDAPGPVPRPLPEGIRLAPLDERDIAAMRAHGAAVVRTAAGFATPDRIGFVLRGADGQPCAAAFFAPHDRFRRPDIARLGPGEYVLVELVTWPEQAGRGLGTLMVQHASRAMLARGATRLVSFMWWSHGASLRVFLKAGWRRSRFAAALGERTRPWLVLRLPPALAPGAHLARPEAG